jgi:hypothetical protein
MIMILGREEEVLEILIIKEIECMSKDIDNHILTLMQRITVVDMVVNTSTEAILEIINKRKEM